MFNLNLFQVAKTIQGSDKHVQNPFNIHLASLRTELENSCLFAFIYIPNVKFSQYEVKLHFSLNSLKEF